MRLRVLWFGRPSASPYEGQVSVYRKRVAHRWPAEDIPLRPAAGGRDDDPRRSLRDEGRAVLVRVEGKPWRPAKGGLECSGRGNFLWAGQRMGAGDFRIRVKLTLAKIRHTAASSGSPSPTSRSG